jgi:hypothetical protein
MPDRPPAQTANVKGAVRPPAGDLGLAFENVDAPAGGSIKAELDSYRAAATLATIFALAGSVGVLMLLVLTIFTFVLPIFRGSDDRAGHTGAGLIWLIASFLCAAIAIVGLFLIRSVVLVVVDAARRLRALERDALAPKRK